MPIYWFWKTGMLSPLIVNVRHDTGKYVFIHRLSWDELFEYSISYGCPKCGSRADSALRLIVLGFLHDLDICSTRNLQVLCSVVTDKPDYCVTDAMTNTASVLNSSPTPPLSILCLKGWIPHFLFTKLKFSCLKITNISWVGYVVTYKASGEVSVILICNIRII